jgi:hypothetical protein
MLISSNKPALLWCVCERISVFVDVDPRAEQDLRVLRGASTSPLALLEHDISGAITPSI